MATNADLGLKEKKAIGDYQLSKDTGAVNNFKPKSTDTTLKTDRGTFTRKS